MNNAKNGLFRKHEIYKPVDKGVWIYGCIERLEDSKFAVQLASFCKGDDGVDGFAQHAHYQADTLGDFVKNRRVRWWSTLEEAIADHDRDFGI
jgi:hypothetical protein